MKRLASLTALMFVFTANACDMGGEQEASGPEASDHARGATAGTAHGDSQDGSSNQDWNAVSAKKLFPPSPKYGTFLYTEGEDEGTKVNYTVSRIGKTDEGEARYKLALKGRLDQYFVRDGKGRVFVERVFNYIRGVKVRFDPPILTLPARLGPGTRHEQKVNMTVRNLDSGEVRDSGTCTARIEKITHESVKTPAGRFDAYVVHLKRTMDMSMANVDMDLDNSYAPQVGLIASDSSRTTNIVGLINRDHHERYERSKGGSEE